MPYIVSPRRTTCVPRSGGAGVGTIVGTAVGVKIGAVGVFVGVIGVTLGDGVEVSTTGEIVAVGVNVAAIVGGTGMVIVGGGGGSERQPRPAEQPAASAMRMSRGIRMRLIASFPAARLPSAFAPLPT